MTEAQIESRVMRWMDHLDRLYLGGQIDESTYNLGVQDLARWADEKRTLPFPSQPASILNPVAKFS